MQSSEARLGQASLPAQCSIMLMGRKDGSKVLASAAGRSFLAEKTRHIGSKDPQISAMRHSKHRTAAFETPNDQDENACHQREFLTS